MEISNTVLRQSWPMFYSIILVFTLDACQGDSPPHLPAEVRAAVVQQLTEVGVDARDVDLAEGLFKPVELTSRGVSDWLVNFNALPNGRLCGTGGCPLQIWVKTGKSPYTLAFDRQVLWHELRGHGNGRRWLAVELHGVLCGGTGSTECRYQFEWYGDADAPDGNFVPFSIRGKPIRYVGPLVQAIPVQPPETGPVANALDAYRAACVATNGSPLMNKALVRIPDLNGDGRPELLFDAGQADCQHDNELAMSDCTAETCLNQLFSEHGGQGWRTVWLGKSFAYTIDFSQPEPRFLIRPADCDESCPADVLAWQSDARRFVALPLEASR